MFDCLKFFVVLCGTAFGALLGISAFSAWAASDSFEISAQAVTGIEFVLLSNMSFATVIPDGSAPGTIVVSTTGARTCTPVLTCSGIVSAASFDITGTPGANYTLTLPPSANITSGANTMLIDNFVSSIGSGAKLKGGNSSFTIGGTLNVGISQPPGNYTGTYTVTVEYN